MKRLSAAIAMAAVLSFRTVALGTAQAAAQGADKKTVLQYAFWGNPDAIGVEQDIIIPSSARIPTSTSCLWSPPTTTITRSSSP